MSFFYYRYYTALERTLFLDHVPRDRRMELWEANCKVHRRGLELIKPGAKCRDIRRLRPAEASHFWLRPFIWSTQSLLRSEAALEIREHVDTVLQPNMVMSMEPHIKYLRENLGRVRTRNMICWL